MPGPAVERPGGVLDVDVVDPVGERPDELDGVDELPEQVAGVEVEAELGAVVERLQGRLGRVDVEGDLGRVDLQGELDAALLEDVEDRVPAVGEQLEAIVDHRVGHRRERVEQVPDRRAGEAVDDLDAQLLGGPRGVLHLLDRPGSSSSWRRPGPRREPSRRSARRVSRARAGRSGGWRSPSIFRPYLRQQVVAPLAIAGVAQGLLHVEVVAPAGQLDAVVAPLAGLLADTSSVRSAHWPVKSVTGRGASARLPRSSVGGGVSGSEIG